MDYRCDCPECTGRHEHRLTRNRIEFGIVIVLLIIALSIAETMA